MGVVGVNVVLWIFFLLTLYRREKERRAEVYVTNPLLASFCIYLSG